MNDEEKIESVPLPEETDKDPVDSPRRTSLSFRWDASSRSFSFFCWVWMFSCRFPDCRERPGRRFSSSELLRSCRRCSFSLSAFSFPTTRHSRS